LLGAVCLLLIHVTAATSLADATTKPAGPTGAPATVAPSSAYENQPIKRSRPAASPDAKPASTFDWQRLVMAMGIVIGLILVLKYVAGRMFPGMAASKGTRVVRVLTRSPIAPKQSVMLLQVGRRVIVVGDSAGQLAPLAQIDDADEVASLLGQVETMEVPTTVRKPFAALFGRAQREFEPVAADLPVEMDETEPVQTAEGIETAQTEISGLIDRMRTLTRTLRRDA
jgi:flagellar biogenesis protein FliO